MKLVPIPADKYEDYRLTLMFECYKWDPQFLDNNTVAKYALVLTQEEHEKIKELTEKLDKETRAAEEFLNQHLELTKPLSLPRKMKKEIALMKDYDPEKDRMLAMETEKKNYMLLTEKSLHPETIDWKQAGFFGRCDTDITVPLLRAIGGIEPMRIIATRPNYGAIADFPAHAAMEYSMDIFNDKITPVKNLYIPKPFRGLIASLSEHQTLLAEAIAKHDPKLFVYALEAYPQNQFSPERKEFFLKMFDIHCDIDPKMHEARHFYE